MTEPFLPPRDRVRIFAHRGLATHARENTLPAFRAALDAGADYLETDVHATLDGACVINHDPALVVAGLTRRIAESTLDELSSGERMPLLEDALREFPDAKFNIDVKAFAAVEPAVAAIRAAGASHRVLVTSFDESTRAAVTAQLPAAATSASSKLVIAALPWLYLGLPTLVRAALRGVDAVQLPERRGPLRLISRRTVRTFHRAGVEVHVWTVNDERDMRRLVALGVDGLVTDRCDLAARIFAS
ncbi:glycerophosphoryl diester phosphodiesterase [Paramicrobacterium humi]|uniref:Glycerophosphoryl diester phosphodiesterase n=1 Tax=Paramicrobacterium humi TaxID=640635 RepID=A0A1H4R5W2_9MICO|nr:glycerophosphodiester phosphodiesterase family protein [Microbacterium humi]SEC27124.1 glycerophosphoryl diester phosphodiesterase [Microbacterium humi]